MHVLVVDDDPDHLRLLTLGFSARGHLVEATQRGLGVIGRLAGWESPPPDVCVVDNYMPEISGVAILRLAARTRRAVDVPVVIYSSDPTVEDLVADIGHPHARFVLKTGRVASLVALVETLCNVRDA